MLVEYSSWVLSYNGLWADRPNTGQCMESRKEGEMTIEDADQTRQVLLDFGTRVTTAKRE